MDLVVSGSSDAILMVECGANGVTEAEVLDALDIAHEEIKKICAALEELRAQGGQGEARDRRSRRSTPTWSSRSAPRTARSSTRRPRSRRSSPVRRPPRRSRRRCSSSTRAAPTARTRSRARRGLARLRPAREGDHPPPDRGGQEAARRARRGRDPADRVRGGRLAPRARLGACSPAGRPRSSPTWRWARAAWTCGSTTSAWSSRRPSGTTTTSRRSRSGRPASCAARSAATSATARSPSARWCRRSRARRTSPM